MTETFLPTIRSVLRVLFFLSLTVEASGPGAWAQLPLRFDEQLVMDGYTYSFGIATADLDGDGDLDITSADALPNNDLYWFENDGQGHFQKRFIQKDDPERLERHAIGDIDGDGHPDVVIVKNLVGDLLWFRNSGRPADGNFWKRHVINSRKIPGAYDVALGDYDGDGDLDVAASTWRLSNNFVWFENDGSPTDGPWTMRLIDQLTTETRMIRAADIDGDKDLDLVGTARKEPLIAWYENTKTDGRIEWKKHPIDNTSPQPLHGQIVDMDADGDLDLVMSLGMTFTGNPSTEQVVWYENDGQPARGVWKKHLIADGYTGSFEACAADMDGDKDVDVVATAWGKDGKVAWFENTGDPSQNWKQHTIKTDWPMANAIQIADLDGDGRLDFVAGAERGANQVRWWRNAGPREAPEIGSVRQLFLDDHIIERIDGLKRTMHQPVKRGAVIKPDQEWETSLQTRCSPAWDEERKLFKLWLITSTNIPGFAGTSYAESADGVHWTKPVLRQTKINGSLENNFLAVVPGDTWPKNGIENVVIDPDDPDPKRRYKGFYGVNGRRPMVSPDGIHWTLLKTAVLPSSDESNMSYDRATNTFIATLKRGGPFGRSHRIWTSHDFTRWSDTGVLFHADELDQQLAKKNIDARLSNPKLQQPVKNVPADYNADIYNFGVFRYEGFYIGMPAVYHATGKLKVNTDGFHLIQLACSRDLKQWTRLGDRQPFIGPSPVGPDVFDRTQLLPPSAPVEHGDELWFYYTGIKYRASPENADEKMGAVCLAVLRRDGFVSLTADEKVGQLITKPFTATGDQLRLNVDVSDEGEATVEVLDEDMQVIDGFELSNSVPLRGRAIEQTVRWTTKADWSQLAGRNARLRIRLRNADLYAFWSAKE